MKELMGEHDITDSIGVLTYKELADECGDVGYDLHILQSEVKAADWQMCNEDLQAEMGEIWAMIYQGRSTERQGKETTPFDPVPPYLRMGVRQALSSCRNEISRRRYEMKQLLSGKRF